MQFEFETVTVNARGEITNRQRRQAKFFTEDLGRGVNLEMVSIPGGSFVMGSPENEKGRRSTESPQHEVNVPPFFLGKYPVTQQQYEAVMGNNPSHFKDANRPVECVSWNDAAQFCLHLSQITGKMYRLPSEAQWEYACRAGTIASFSCGPTITTDLANYDGSNGYDSEPKGIYRAQTTQVGSFLPNAFGLYDMHGNVLEWCQDLWHKNYNDAPTDGSVWEFAGNSYLKLLRGGSWNYSPWICRSAYRYWVVEGLSYYDRGLRIICW